MTFEQVYELAVSGQPLPQNARTEELGAYYALVELHTALLRDRLPRAQYNGILNGRIRKEFRMIRQQRELIAKEYRRQQEVTLRADGAEVALLKQAVPGADPLALLYLAADCISLMKGAEQTNLRTALEKRLRGELPLATKAGRRSARWK